MIGPESRYNYAAIMRVVSNNGFLVEREHLDLRPTLVTTVHPDNQQFTPAKGDTWSRIAWRRLGNGRRYWIICDYSGIIDPFSELRPRKKYRARTQLTVNVSAGAVNTITVGSLRGIRRGSTLLIEDLNPANLVSFEATVLATNATTNVIQLTPATCPAGGVPFALSRVSEVYEETITLTCPSINRALFNVLDFANPLNVLVE